PERQHPPLRRVLLRGAAPRARGGHGMTTFTAASLALAVQTVAVVAVAPVVVGVMRQVRARLEGRAGPGILQPWRDLRKLLRKSPLTAPGVILGSVLPLVLMATSLLLVA